MIHITQPHTLQSTSVGYLQEILLLEWHTYFRSTQILFYWIQGPLHYLESILNNGQVAIKWHLVIHYVSIDQCITQPSSWGFLLQYMIINRDPHNIGCFHSSWFLTRNSWQSPVVEDTTYFGRHLYWPQMWQLQICLQDTEKSGWNWAWLVS